MIIKTYIAWIQIRIMLSSANLAPGIAKGLAGVHSLDISTLPFKAHGAVGGTLAGMCTSYVWACLDICKSD